MIGKFRFSAAALAGVVMPVAILSACGGKGVTIGSNSEELRTVDPKTVTGTVPACAPQQAHPNVCCKGSPTQESACVAFVNSPFHKCGDDYNTFPNPNECCELSDPTRCASPPPGPPPPVECGYACAPGWWPVANNPGECCRVLPGGASLECSQYTWGVNYMEPTSVCTMPSPSPLPPHDLGDGGVPAPTDAGPPSDGGHADGGWADAEPMPDDAGWFDGDVPPPYECDAGPPPPPPPPWPGPICEIPCPAGFQPLAGDRSICCALQPNGAELCFSQAAGSAAQGSGGGSGSSGGSNGSGGAATPPSPGK